MKKIAFLFICVLFVSTFAFAQNPFQEIDEALDRAFQHARNYPPEFSSETQRAELEKELILTIAQLDRMIAGGGPNPEIFFRLGKAYTFAYNLDMAGSREAADENFEQLFALDRNHGEGHLYYGQHLVGRGETEKGIAHLQMAVDDGWDIALNMIGLAYLQSGQTEKARPIFLELQKKYPQDPQLQLLLESLDPDGEYEYQIMQE